MHLKPKYINALINIFIGVAWAIALIGFIKGFVTSYGSNFFVKLIDGFIFSIPGLFLLLLIEFIYAKFILLEETRKQREILKEILKSLQEKE